MQLLTGIKTLLFVTPSQRRASLVTMRTIFPGLRVMRVPCFHSIAIFQWRCRSMTLPFPGSCGLLIELPVWRTSGALPLRLANGSGLKNAGVNSKKR
jgi:hypothetical protein